MYTRPEVVEKLSGTISQELPEMSRSNIRLAFNLARVHTREAQREREGAASARRRLAELEFRVCTSGENFLLEDEVSACLGAALEHARMAANGLFHAYAAEWWSVLSPDAERFSDRLQALGEQVEKELACPEFACVIRGAISRATIEWMQRSASEIIPPRLELQSPEGALSLPAQGGSDERYKGVRLSNVDALRRECGLSLDELAVATRIDRKLVQGHVNGKGAHPSTLKKYADAFSKKLGRTVSVADLGGQTS